MKTAIFLLVATASVSYAQKNPQIRACHTQAGIFKVFQTSDMDQVGACQFDLSFVGSIDIMNKDSQLEAPLSLHNYRKGVQSCILNNRTALTTSSGQEIQVCYYSDGSFMDMATLTSGKDNIRNRRLNSVLGLSPAADLQSLRY